MKMRLSVMLALVAGVLARAEALPEKSVAETGYEVTVDVTVGPDGKAEQVQLVHADTLELGKLAVALAPRCAYAPRVENAKPVRSVQRKPLFFPVEGDLGPEAQKRPRPTARIMPCPNFPFEMRKADQPGGAIVSLLVNKEGRVKDAKLLRASHEKFGRATMETVTKWVFRPALEDGKPVESYINVAVAFEVNGKVPEGKWYVAPRPTMDAYIVSATYVPAR